MSFGKRVKKLREKKGLTRQELSQALNITYAALSKYETDERFPSEDILSRIADYFEVSIDELIGRVYSSDIDSNYVQSVSHTNRYSKELEKHIETAKEISQLEEDDQRFILEMIKKLKRNKQDK